MTSRRKERDGYDTSYMKEIEKEEEKEKKKRRHPNFGLKIFSSFSSPYALHCCQLILRLENEEE